MNIARMLILALLLPALNVLAADLAITSIKLESVSRAPDGDYIGVYTATLTNSGPAQNSVIATVVSKSADIKVVEGTVSFGNVAARAVVKSIDTFTLRSATKDINSDKLVWTVTGLPAKPIDSEFTFTPTTGNAPLPVRFKPVPITDTAINSFEWDFNGDGVVDRTDSVGRDQTWSYTAPGSYAVSLKITDSQNRTDTEVKTVVVGNASPVISASASPTNGEVPLTVNFTASATDSNGVTKFEWDFEGDGSYDRTINGSSGNTSFIYTKAGVYQAKVRVTDTLGAKSVASVPTMEVRAGPAGSPQARLSVSPSSGAAPLAVSLSATFSDPNGLSVKNYQWDADGNGTFDSTTTTNSYSYTYARGGTFYPRVRITMSDGRRADDVKKVVATSTVELALSTDTLDAQLAQTIEVTSTLSANTRTSVVIETLGGTLVRTLVPLKNRTAGTYADTWDGKSDRGEYVAEGVYKAVLLYDLNGALQRLDASTTTGGVEFDPPRSAVPATFEPYNNQPLTIDFTLDRAAEVTAFMGSYDVDTRYVTFYTREPFGRGSHRIIWNGDNADGQIIKPGPGDSFLFGMLAYTLPDNAIFVRNGVQLSAMSASPPIFDPTGATPSGKTAKCDVQFALSLPATVELTVQDSITGRAVARVQYPELRAGTNTVQWDGRASDGRYVAAGTYRLGVTAIQANGFRSMSSYVLQRVFY
jgi:PKD repeat protein